MEHRDRLVHVTDQTDLESSTPLVDRFWPGLLVLVSVLGCAIRLVGLNSGTLYKDDAWVALTSRVPWSSAMHMMVTAPGFTSFEKIWIGLVPGNTPWAQIPSLIAGVVSIPAVFWLFRVAHFERWVGLLAAMAMASAVPAIVYATHIKPYSFDLLIGIALLALSIKSTELLSKRTLLSLTMLSFFALLWSLSLTVVVLGCWVPVAILALRTRSCRAVAAAGVLAVVLTGLIEEVALKSQQTASLHASWSSWYLHTDSLGVFVHSAGAMAFRLFALLTIGRGGVPSLALGLLSLAVWGVVVVLAARRVPVAASVLGVAVLAAAAHVVPIGTQRSDLCLIPALLLLLGGAGATLVEDLKGWVGPSTALLASRLWQGAAVVVAAALCLGFAPTRIAYQPGQTKDAMRPNLRPAEAVTERALLASPHAALLVEETRFEWAYYFVQPVVVRPDRTSQTGFTVNGPHPRIALPLASGLADRVAIVGPVQRLVDSSSPVLTVRPDGERFDPVGVSLEGRCFAVSSTRHVGTSMVTWYDRTASCSTTQPHAASGH